MHVYDVDSGAATVRIVGVRTPRKFKLGFLTPTLKLKGNIRLTSQQRDVGISHFEAAVKCTKRCVKSHEIAHETPQNHLRLGSLPHSPDTIVGWGDTPVTGHFGHKTLRHQDTLGHFGTETLRHHKFGAEV